MRYIINFQIIIVGDKISNDVIRSSYTILEKDSEKYNLTNIKQVEFWFKEHFKEKPLDNFIDTKKISKKTNLDMKIGRITNSISGEYKTY
ncbi:MAG: hypothetical protein CML36_02060 [Rhodobacteraceae bacterium]|nr:hypothetical protein [Paracoccaceae bacterium]OUU62504.1 MAG: hypothetical protein CBC22_04250 [Alphaproteobacteria bacterium TMED62]|tara:strand:- start:1305 stop:1574 length:270 start_codon:yes stop_codon:yes gene_type:complete